MKQITSQTAEVEAAAARAAADEIRIALTMLENMPSGARACDRARHWFEGKFPNGGERAEVWDACPNWEWKVWFAVHSATTEEAVAFAQSCADRAAFYAKYAVAVAAKAAAAADAYAAEAADYAAEAADYAADADTYNAAAYARVAAAYAEAAARVVAVAHYEAEVQAQIAWAHKVLFG